VRAASKSARAAAKSVEASVAKLRCITEERQERRDDLVAWHKEQFFSLERTAAALGFMLVKTETKPPPPPDDCDFSDSDVDIACV